MREKLIDQWGNPLSSKNLGREIAAPTVGGLRDVWADTIVSGMTPVLLADVLRQAAQGYPDRFFVLAEEMEERDLHYRAVLSTRKTALTGIAPTVVPASNSAADIKIADAVREMIAQPTFVDDYMTDLLDALGKGYSVVETIWDRSSKEWWPCNWKRRDQRFFQINRRDGIALRLKSSGHADGEELPPYQFSIHRPKLKSGLPIRSGLARLAAWAFLFKSYTLKDWMAFLEVYGMPLRVGKYGASSSMEERRVLIQAVRDLSTDAAAIIPKEMEIDFVEASGGTGNAVFASKAEYLDRQTSKGVLGQTMTTDDGSSLGQAKVHENVRHDIARSDSRQLSVTVSRDLVVPFVDINFGPQDRYPVVLWPVTENEDIDALSNTLQKLVPLGLKVSEKEARERVGFSEPDKGDSILQAAPAATPSVTTDKAQRLLPSCLHCGGGHAIAADGRGELDMLIEEALEDWQEDLNPIIKPLQSLFERATSYAQLERGLDDMLAKMNSGPLADRLAKLQMIARGLGDTGDAGR